MCSAGCYLEKVREDFYFKKQQQHPCSFRLDKLESDKAAS